MIEHASEITGVSGGQRIAAVAPGTQPALQELEKRILAERGRISPLYQVLLNSPVLAEGWEQLLSAVRNRSSVPDHIRELVILRIAVLNKAPYEFAAHRSHAERAGVTAAQMDALQRAPVGCCAEAFSNKERDVLALTDTMTTKIEVADAEFDAAMRYFNPCEQVELVATIAAYNMVSRFLSAFRIGHQSQQPEFETSALLLRAQVDASEAGIWSQTLPTSGLLGNISYRAFSVVCNESGMLHAYFFLNHASLVTQGDLQHFLRDLADRGLPGLQQAKLSRLESRMNLAGASAGSSASHHYVVEMDPAHGWAAELEQWYDTEHMPGLAAVPGCISAVRYYNHDEGPLSLAAYDLTASSTLQSQAWLAVRATAWSARVRPNFTNTRRTMFRVLA